MKPDRQFQTGRVRVTRLSGKLLHLTARSHEMFTDRTVAEGGSDRGCTSGELLLMAVGSCAAGSLRNFFQERGVADPQLEVDVIFESITGERDRIVIMVELGGEAVRFSDDIVASAATEGGVTSRIKLGSQVQVRMMRKAPAE